MPIASIPEFVNALRDSQLLDAGQWEELTQTLHSQCETCQQLAEQLVQRHWLTSYQAEQILHHNGVDVKLGPYRLLEKLGEGGMGQVYKAVHQRLQRTVALKVIREERLLRDPDAIHRFQREAQAAAQLSHPNIVLVYDADKVGDTHFIAMEFVEGIDLAKLVKRSGPLPIPQACDYIRQAALGLQHAHECGLVHRDIKPSNLLVTTAKAGKTVSGFFRRATPGAGGERPDPSSSTPTSTVVKILDLGLARRLVAGADKKNQSFLTEDGDVLGTPDFIAPEQARNAHNADIRADLYSLGCTFYYLLAGRAPFPEGSAIEKLLKHQLDPPTPLQELRPQVPAQVEHIVATLMAKPPEQRYQTPEGLVAALDALSAGAPPVSAARAPAEAAAAVATKKPREAWPTLITTPRQEGAPIPVEKPALTTAVVPIQPLSADQTETGESTVPLEAWATLGQHKGPVLAVAFSERSGLLASGGVDGLIRLWDVSGPAPREHAVLEGHRSDVGGLAFAPDGPSVLASASGHLDGAVCLWDLAAAKPLGKAVLRGHNSPVTAMAFSPDGSFLAVGCNDRSVHLWHLSREEPREKSGFRAHGSFAKSLAIAPDGKTIATGGEDGIVHLYRRGMLWTNHVAQLPVHLGPVLSLAFAPDGKTLASGSMDRSVWLGDLGGDKPLDRAVLEGHLDMVSVVQFSPDGKSLFSVGRGVKVIQWDVAGAVKLRECQLGRTLVISVALSRDGRILAIGNNDGSISLLRIKLR